MTYVYACMYVYDVCIYIHMCVCPGVCAYARLHQCMHVWRSEIDSRCLCHSSPYLLRQAVENITLCKDVFPACKGLIFSIKCV